RLVHRHEHDEHHRCNRRNDHTDEDDSVDVPQFKILLPDLGELHAEDQHDDRNCGIPRHLQDVHQLFIDCDTHQLEQQPCCGTVYHRYPEYAQNGIFHGNSAPAAERCDEDADCTDNEAVQHHQYDGIVESHCTERKKHDRRTVVPAVGEQSSEQNGRNILFRGFHEPSGEDGDSDEYQCNEHREYEQIEIVHRQFIAVERIECQKRKQYVQGHGRYRFDIHLQKFLGDVADAEDEEHRQYNHQ